MVKNDLNLCPKEQFEVQFNKYFKKSNLQIKRQNYVSNLKTDNLKDNNSTSTNNPYLIKQPMINEENQQQQEQKLF